MNTFPTRPLLPRSLPLVWLLSITIALGSLRFLIADIAVVMPGMLHHALDRPLALYAHLICGPTALALLPFQFSTKIRAKWPVVHRWLGRIYGVAILVGGLTGIVIGAQTTEGPVAATGLIILAIFWLGITGYAVWLAITRQIAAHRRWMIRSAALTLAGVTLRLYLPIGIMTVGFEIAYPWICWLCWVPNIIFAEALLRSEKRKRLSQKKPA